MSNLGKCVKCGKTCYALEGFKVGPPGGERVVHKGCFKCEADGCAWRLSLKDYKSYEGRFYCKHHCPMTGSTNKDKAKGTVAMDAFGVQQAVNAPKAHDTVNEQVRAGGAAGTVTHDSMAISQAVNAPKASEPVNEQVRAGGAAGNVTSNIF